MIYFTNTSLDTPHMAFIGRWSPFHKGHAAIIIKKIYENPHNPVLILIRNTTQDQYTPSVRAEYLKSWMIENRIQGTIMIIPNIEGVYWGRDVGYRVELVNIDEYTKQISGTKIRKAMQLHNAQWRSLVAHQNSSYMLSAAISSIIDHGLVVWLTGCPSSGKTTIATKLITTIRSRYPHLKIQLLDGDEMRGSPLAQHVGFEPKDRADHIIRMAYLAKMFTDHGILTICAFVSPDRVIRTKAKKIIGDNRFIEVYVRASKSTRIKRDTKGMYKKAIAGTLKKFTGYNAPYQIPIKPNIICNTDNETIAQSTNAILAHIFRDR